MSEYRVVFHLDEPSRGRAIQVLENIENLLADLGQDQVTVELVANGGGVKALLGGPRSHAAKVIGLAARGVRFLACANSLKHLELSPDELLEPVEVVAAGVGELVRRQAEGWAYIRP